MSEMSVRESQVIDVMQCDVATARRALQQNNDDVDQAINALLSGTVTTESQVTSYTPPVGKDTTSNPIQGPEPRSVQGVEGTSDTADGSWADRASEGLRRSERNASSKQQRNSPIDLTGNDEDEDLRKAMQASLESESNRQKRHQEYGIGSSNGAASGNGGRANAQGVSNVEVTTQRTTSNGLRGQKVYDSGHRRHRHRHRRRHRRCRRDKKRDDPTDCIDLISEDDEALTRAIEASMLHSHQSTRAQSPLLSASQLDAIGANQLRSSDKPVAILAPSTFVRVFALALQALYASEMFRKALLDVRFTDVRTRDADAQLMEGFWRGASPANTVKPTQEQWNFVGGSDEERKWTDVLMRLSTLFTFMTYTKRPLVVADDMITHVAEKNYAYVMNSERKPTQDVLACYVQSTLDHVCSAIGALEAKSNDLHDEKAFKRSFQSTLVSALSPAEAHRFATADDFDVTPKDPFEVVVFTLTQSKLNNSVHQALYAHLAEEKTLFSDVGETLIFCLGDRSQYNPNFGASAWGVPSNVRPEQQTTRTAFRLESRIYLDAFTFRRRKGERLGFDSDEVKARQSRIEELERYKRSICTHQGEDSRAMLKTSIAYFHTTCKADETDAVRSAAVQEAGPRLEAILAHLEQEINAVDDELQRQRCAVEDMESSMRTSFEVLLGRQDHQTMPYDLRSVVMEADGRAWTYVLHRDEFDADRSSTTTMTNDERAAQWWRICEGEVVRVTESDVLNDEATINFMVYAVANNERPSERDSSMSPIDDGGKPSKTIRLDSSRDWWTKQSLVEAIEHDNATFGTHLANNLSTSVSMTMESNDERPTADMDTLTGDETI